MGWPPRTSYTCVPPSCSDKTFSMLFRMTYSYSLKTNTILTPKSPWMWCRTITGPLILTVCSDVCFSVLWHWAFDPGETAPRGCLIPRAGQCLPFEQSDLSSSQLLHPQPSPSQDSHTPRQYFPCPKWSQSQLPDSYGSWPPITQSLMNLFYLVLRLLSIPILPLLPIKTLKKGSGSCSPFFFFCLLTCSDASAGGPVWHAEPLVSRDLWVQTPSLMTIISVSMCLIPDLRKKSLGTF